MIEYPHETGFNETQIFVTIFTLIIFVIVLVSKYLLDKADKKEQVELELKQKEQEKQKLDLELKQKEQVELELKQKEQEKQKLDLELKQKEQEKQKLDLELKQTEQKDKIVELAIKQKEQEKQKLDLELQKKESKSIWNGFNSWLIEFSLNTTKKKLTEIKTELIITKKKLDNAIEELETKTEVVTAKVQLENTNTQVATAKVQLEKIESQNKNIGSGKIGEIRSKVRDTEIKPSDIVSIIGILITIITVSLSPLIQTPILDYKVIELTNDNDTNKKNLEIIIKNLGITTAKNILLSLNSNYAIKYGEFDIEPYLPDNIINYSKKSQPQKDWFLLIDTMPPRSKITANLTITVNNQKENKIISYLGSDETVGNFDVTKIIGYYIGLGVYYGLFAILFGFSKRLGN